MYLQTGGVQLMTGLVVARGKKCRIDDIPAKFTNLSMKWWNLTVRSRIQVSGLPEIAEMKIKPRQYPLAVCQRTY